MRSPKALRIVIVLLSVAYYAISPLFRNVRLDEAVPQAEQASTTTSANIPQTSGSMFASVTGTAGHPASGTARVVGTDGKTYIRYENFKTINGPDIYVYLSKDLNAKEFVDLGEVRATEGNINYEVPSSVDLSEYNYVLTWCKQFGVLFNYADLSQIR